MKKLTADGTTLIVYLPTFYGHFSLRDPWPTHAASYPQWVLQQLSSGYYTSVLQVYLEEGVEYFYACGGIRPYDEAVILHYENETWIHPDGIVGKFGEWWNVIGRSSCFYKGKQADFNEWVLTH